MWMRGLNQHPAKVPFVVIRAVGSNPTVTASYNGMAKEIWAVGIVGNTVALQASVPGSNPGRSTSYRGIE